MSTMRNYDDRVHEDGKEALRVGGYKIDPKKILEVDLLVERLERHPELFIDICA